VIADKNSIEFPCNFLLQYTKLGAELSDILMIVGG
jgi:hypothetical protein